MSTHQENQCSCTACIEKALSASEIKAHQIQANASRRDFLRNAGRLGLGVGGGLLASPLAG
jgi:hypothetical protein